MAPDGLIAALIATLIAALNVPLSAIRSAILSAPPHYQVLIRQLLEFEGIPQEILSEFKHFDGDGNGRISAGEVRRALHHFGIQVSDAQVGAHCHCVSLSAAACRCVSLRAAACLSLPWMAADGR